MDLIHGLCVAIIVLLSIYESNSSTRILRTTFLGDESNHNVVRARAIFSLKSPLNGFFLDEATSALDKRQ